MKDSSIDLESLINRPSKRLQDMRQKLTTAGCTNPDSIISYIGMDLTPEKEDDLIFYTKELIKQKRFGDFPKLWLALELSDRYSRCPKYRESVLFAINFDLEFDHSINPYLTEYETLFKFHQAMPEVVQNIGVKKLKRNNDKLAKQILNNMSRRPTQIMYRLKQFQEAKLDPELINTYLSSTKNRFLSVADFVQRKKLDKDSTYLLLTNSINTESMEQLIPEGTSLENIAKAAIAMSIYPAQTTELIAKQLDINTICSELKLNEQVIKSLIHLTRMTKAAIHIKPIYDIMIQKPTQFKELINMGADAEEVRQIITFYDDSPEAVRAFMKGKKSDVRSYNISKFVDMYNSYPDIVKHYLETFDAREINNLHYIISQNPEAVRICMNSRVPLTEMYGICHESSNNIEALRRAKSKNVPRTQWKNYIRVYRDYKEGIDYVEAINIPIGTEFFAIASGYEQFKQISHAYLGTATSPKRKTLDEIKSLILLTNYDWHRVDELAQIGVALEDLPNLIDLADDNYKILLKDHSLEKIANLKELGSDHRRSQKFKIGAPNYKKEMHYYNFDNPKHTIDNILKFLNKNEGKEYDEFKQNLDNYINTLKDKKDAQRFFVDAKEFDDKYIAKKISHLKDYQKHIENNINGLFDVKAIVEANYWRIIQVFPGTVEKGDLSKEGIDGIPGHFNDTICYAITGDIEEVKQRTILASELQSDLHDQKPPKRLSILKGGRYENYTAILDEIFVDSAAIDGFEFAAIVPAYYQTQEWPRLNSTTNWQIYADMPLDRGYQLTHLPKPIEVKTSKQNIQIDLLWLKKIDKNITSKFFVST